MALDISRIKALCFDVDGTLRDTDDHMVRQLAVWLRPIRFLFRDHDPTHFSRRVIMAAEDPGTYLYRIPDRMGIDDWLATVGETLHRVGLGTRTREFILIPGAVDMLYRLRANYPMAIVSARGKRGTMDFLNASNLASVFTCIATAQTCRHTKPFPDQINWAADQMGVESEACLMIGDTKVDIRAGKAAGAQTIGVLSGFGEEWELHKVGADIILPGVASLPEVLLTPTGNQEPAIQPGYSQPSDHA